MNREPVDSEAIRPVGYDPESGSMEIEFRSGGVYRYRDVPPEDWERLREIGFEALYLSDVLPENENDKEILDWMETHGTFNLTRDKRFPDNGGELKIIIDGESPVRLTRSAVKELLARGIYPLLLLGCWSDMREKA